MKIIKFLSKSITSQTDMERQPLFSSQQLSKKSRGILFHLKQNLQKNKLSLRQHICNTFGFFQQSFTPKKFETIIKAYDPDLIYDDIDTLFEELDDSKNGRVFYYRLQQAYDKINESDRLIDRIGQSLKEKAHKIKNQLFPSPNKEEVIEEVRNQLLSSEDLYEVIDLFAVDKTGFLTVENVIELLKNFEVNSDKKRRIVLEHVFQQKGKVPIQAFISKMGLESLGRRVNISKLQQNKTLQEKKPHQDYIPEEMKSQFVKSKLRESRVIEEDAMSVSLDLRSVRSSDEFISLEKIPPELQAYYNYGSVLEPQFAYLATEYLGKKQLFIDSENPIYSKAYQWVHYSELRYDFYTLFRVSESVLLRDKKKKGLGQLLQSKDIIQGRLGDCYFLSAISAIVERYPELVYRLFVIDKNPSHIYGVRLFIDGIWKTIVLDACFPISQNGTFCGAQPYKDQIWVMLLEKAWAKVFGSYDNIHAGYNEQGLTAIAGAPSVHASGRQPGFLKKLHVYLNKGAIITCATALQVQQMTDQQQDALGIYSNHAYTLLAVFPDLPYKQRNITLLKIRNPWGRKQWKGDWSYQSNLWTQELRILLNYELDPKDGSFYMDFETFMMYFDFVNICQVNLSYQTTSLLIQADRNEFKVVVLKIKQKGDYFFTQYQENPRKYKNSMMYKKSKSWLFLLKIQKDNRVAIGSHCSSHRDNTLEATLQPGEYILLSRIDWKYWDKHAYTLTSYGPDKVALAVDTRGKLNPLHELASYIKYKSVQGLGKSTQYQNLNISKRIHFDPLGGYGLIELINFENRVFSLKIVLNPCKGIFILPPYGLPIELQIFPGETVTVKFLVDPEGYYYNLRQRYSLLNM